MDRVDGQLVDPIGPDQQHRPFAYQPRELADHLEADLVRPLQILEGEQGRPIGGGDDRVREIPDQHASRAERVAAIAPAHLEKLLAQGPEPGGRAHRPGEIEDRREGDESVLRRQVTLGDPEAGRSGLVQDGAHQPGLADAGLAGEQDQLPAAARGLRDASLGEVEQVVAADEQGTEERPELCHGRECRAARTGRHR